MSNQQIQQKFEQAYHSFIEEENYEEALKRAEILCLLNPQSVEFHHKVAYVYLKQLNWEKAIEAEMKTLELDCAYIPALDLLAHAYGGLENWERTGFYGHQALVLKDKAIPDLQHEIIPAPAPKDGKRIISFSLFGNSSKYIEPAVLNTQLAPVLFPGWTCRFYVDDSVPAEAIQRFKANGAEVIHIDPQLRNWPGTMWRFLAINDPEVEYVIFRDADSIICYRDAASVSEWIKSGALFHTIRDSGSHTALILAGMWGAKAGAVPNMRERIQNFIDSGYSSRHFADQDFLEKELWAYIRQNLFAHDRLFNFRNPHDIPGEFNPDYQIAFCEGATSFNATTDYEDNSLARWTLYSRVSPLVNRDYSLNVVPEFKVCSYVTEVKNGIVSASLPRRYGNAIKAGLAKINIERI